MLSSPRDRGAAAVMAVADAVAATAAEAAAMAACMAVAAEAAAMEADAAVMEAAGAVAATAVADAAEIEEIKEAAGEEGKFPSILFFITNFYSGQCYIVV